MSRRAALIVLDGLGVGTAHDTAAYGDLGSATLGNVVRAEPGGLRLPNLEALGLGQYADTFAENDITLEMFAELTDKDLKELGVTALGHRKKLLAEIAKRAQQPRAQAKPAAVIPAPAVQPGKSTTSATNRTLS